MDNIAVALTTGCFTLAGVLVASVVNRWQRREKLAAMLFDKKIDAYRILMGKTAEVMLYVIMHKGDESISSDLAIKAEEITNCLLADRIFVTDKAADVVMEFVKCCVNPEVDFEMMTNAMSSANGRLKDLVKKELGLKALEKYFTKP
uniref:Uncharacterized protein n=1 Tax=viral metagenome TaxID=1070528 RepID=A0A6M3J994_9ZZZZ